jgi:hypothetical protein
MIAVALVECVLPREVGQYSGAIKQGSARPTRTATFRKNGLQTGERCCLHRDSDGDARLHEQDVPKEGWKFFRNFYALLKLNHPPEQTHY